MIERIAKRMIADFKHKCPLKNAEIGKVVTRFPPEPSGCLHIGHAKALVLNHYYAKLFKGKMILRFDDTNPAKDQKQFTEMIKEDINYMGIIPDVESFTSDYFSKLYDFAEQMLRSGDLYADDTGAEEMKAQRNCGINSKNREATVEQNLDRWQEMKKGSEIGKKFCLRAKISMQAKSKCLRDPVLYRSSHDVHFRTRDLYKAFPCYDFACPIVDSLEGVTHAMRTTEYRERDPLYEWVMEKAKLRPVLINSFSKLSFRDTILSKRRLSRLIDRQLVEGWDDPRLATLRGIMRRGLVPTALSEFILELGPSTNNVCMEWDKLWKINAKKIDDISPRFFAIKTASKMFKVTIENFSSLSQHSASVPLHPKQAALGKKQMFFSQTLLIEPEDVKDLIPGDRITLLKWGNARVKTVISTSTTSEIQVEFLPNDKDFKTTKKKISWIPQLDTCIPCKIIRFENVLKGEVGSDEDSDFPINPNSKTVTEFLGEPALRSVKQGQTIQIERRGYFYVDAVNSTLTLHSTPDGRSKPMSALDL